ncbi:hypothetical protein [Microcoleus sp. herbarium2]|uniref:hypothetical protein n=1 Tax=Microcoleus sp. herbarium2 TaxID=3055433 RepID=UPI002FCF69D0
MTEKRYVPAISCSKFDALFGLEVCLSPVAALGAEYYEEKYRQLLVSKLEETAQSLGFDLVAKTPHLD